MSPSPHLSSNPPRALPLNRGGISPGDRICAAVSGGADSVALLLSLHAANRAPPNPLGVGLAAAHVHHGLRGAEADADLDFVRDLCARLDLPLHVHHTSVPERVRQTGETVEEAARVLRYGFFEALIASGEADSVLTAHTMNDQAETVLMKLLRGAWTEGLGGIHPMVAVPGSRPGQILRPLLGVCREQVEAFLTEAGQGWREDASNLETIYTRNRIRRQLMPLLRDFNPGIDKALSNLAELARGDESYWQRTMAQLVPQMLLPGKPVRGGGRAVSTAPGQAGVAIELKRLRALDVATRRRVLRAAARRMGARLTFDETARLMAMCEPSSAATGLHLAGELRVQRSIRELRLFRAESSPK